jgi:hypothetical protein
MCQDRVHAALWQEVVGEVVTVAARCSDTSPLLQECRMLLQTMGVVDADHRISTQVLTV